VPSADGVSRVRRNGVPCLRRAVERAHSDRGLHHRRRIANFVHVVVSVRALWIVVASSGPIVRTPRKPPFAHALRSRERSAAPRSEALRRQSARPEARIALGCC